MSAQGSGGDPLPVADCWFLVSYMVKKGQENSLESLLWGCWSYSGGADPIYLVTSKSPHQQMPSVWVRISTYKIGGGGAHKHSVRNNKQNKDMYI